MGPAAFVVIRKLPGLVGPVPDLSASDAQGGSTFRRSDRKPVILLGGGRFGRLDAPILCTLLSGRVEIR